MAFFLLSERENVVVMRYISGNVILGHQGRQQAMIKPTLYAKWISLVFAAFLLAACSNNDTKEAEATAAAAEEQAAQEAAAREAEQQAQVKAQQGREAAAANMGTVFYFEFDSSSLTDDAPQQLKHTRMSRSLSIKRVIQYKSSAKKSLLVFTGHGDENS